MAALADADEEAIEPTAVVAPTPQAAAAVAEEEAVAAVEEEAVAVAGEEEEAVSAVAALADEEEDAPAAAPAPAQQRAAISVDVEEQVEQGLLAYRDQDFEAAYSLWLPVAEGGNADAQFFLGGLYMDGAGVDEYLTRAHAWWRLSAEQGHAKATEFLDLIRSIMTEDQIDAAERLSLILAAK